MAAPVTFAWPAIVEWVEREQMQVITGKTVSDCIESVYHHLDRRYTVDAVIVALKGLNYWPYSIGRCAYAIVFDKEYEKMFPRDWYM